ncbi:MAG TPA: hypothetical protein VGL75_04420 [Acidothermaceae bacterium]|jgi:hypothetical protein
MGFTKPPPPFTRIGIGTTLIQPPLFSLSTQIMAVSRYPSMVIVPSWSPQSGSYLGFTVLTVTWYGDPLGNLTVGTENHAIPPFRLPQIVTQVKGPFAVVSMGYAGGDAATLDVYSSDTQVQNFERLDSAEGLLVNLAGLAVGPWEILYNDTSGTGILVGVAKNSQPMLVCKVYPKIAGVTTTTALTVTADVTIPDGFGQTIDLGSVTTTPITTPTTAGGPVFTPPIALPPMPSGGVPFDIALTANVAAPSVTRGFDLAAFAY